MEYDFGRKATFLLIGLLLILTSTFAFGQGIITGSISGTVQDQQQAVVSGAKITAKSNETNQEFTAESNSVGVFALRGLPIGSYSVTIEAPKFQKLRISNVAVITARDTALGIKTLTIGAEEIVNVESTPPLVETTTAAVTTSFESKRITDLPTGINFDALALYVPGVTHGGSAGRGNSNGAQLSVNGQRTRSNNFQIDGQYNNDNSVAGPGIFLENADALQEVQVSNNYSSEFGRNTGSVVNYVTKSGTNAFHGTVFEYYRGSLFDSLTNDEKSPAFGFCRPGEDPAVVGCTVPQQSRFNQNIFGFTFGGPVLKDKLWFFGSYLADRARSAGFPTTADRRTPTPAGLQTLAAAFPNSAGVDALLAGAPGSDFFAGVPRSFELAPGPGPDGILGTPDDAGPFPVTDGVTTAQVEFGFPTFSPSTVDNIRQFTAKVDFQPTSKDRLWFRYIRDDEISSNTDAFGTGESGLFADIPSGGKQYGAGWTRTWSSTFVNEVRFGYAFLNVGFEDGTFQCNRGNFTECLPRVAFQDSDLLPFGLAPNAPQGRTVKNYQVQDNASWVKGRHTFKFGGEYDRQNSPSDFLPGANGSYTFGTAACPVNPMFDPMAPPGAPNSNPTVCVGDYDALVRNLPLNFSMTDGPLGFPFVENDLAFYFQDDWRIKENLTLNLGVRWEWASQSINLLHDLAVANQSGSNPFWDTTLPENVIAPPRVPNDLNNLSPVIGFAWTPRIFESVFGKDKTVVRGGFRISYDPAFYNIHLNVATSAPTVNASGTLTGDSVSVVTVMGVPTPTVTPGVPIPGLPGTVTFTGNDVRAIGLPFIPTGGNPGFRTQTTVAPDFRNPYTQQWSLGVQREINPKVALEVRYLGSHTVGQFQSVNGNPSLLALITNGFDGSNPNRQDVIPDGVTPCTTAGTPGFTNRYADCNFRNVVRRQNSAFGIYHSLQSRFDIRNWHGVTSTLAYTWSHNIDNASEIFSTTGAGLLSFSQNPFDINRGERGTSLFDYRHNLALQFIYELPWFRSQQGVLGHFLGGWQFSTAYRYTTGDPYTPIQPKSGAQGTSPGLCDPTGAFTTTLDNCRPILLDASAPFDAVGRCNNATCTSVTDLRTGTAGTTLDGFHWLVNNLNAAIFFGSPFTGVGRYGERGQPVNNASMAVFKTTKITERVSVQFQFQAFNVFNRPYYGLPGNNITRVVGTKPDCLSFLNTGSPCTFGSNAFSFNGGGQVNPTQNGIGRRRISAGLKVIF